MKESLNSHFWVICLFTLFTTTNSFAQGNINGLISDEHEPIGYANVLLLQSSDSTLVTGNISDEQGRYLFENIEKGNYLIQVSMIGYQDQYSERFIFKGEDFTIPKFILTKSSSQLEEVQVVAKRALIEQKIDRMVVNVSNSVTSAGNTALEVLKRSPGVMVNPQTNSISMSGKEGVIIMINGKISRMPMDAIVNMLSGMSSDNIDKIELIHTPPASFEAEGNAGFINIVLKKNQNEGLNGGFSVNAGYGKQEKVGSSFNFNYRKNKVNIFGDYSWNYNNNPQLFTNYRSFEYEGVIFENDGEGVRDPTKTHVQNAQFGIDIQASDKTVIGGLFSWMDRDWKLDALNTTLVSENGVLVNRINIPNTEINHSYRLLGNINLQHQIAKGHKVNFDLDYAYFYNDNPSNYLNQYYDGDDNLIEETELRVAKNTPMNILVGKFDHTKSIGDKISLETGVKGTMTSFDNDVLVENKIGDEWVRSSMFSSRAKMTEDIGAVYSSLSWQLNDKIDVKAGLRYEYTDVNLGTEEEPNIVDRQYHNLFPSFFITNKLNKNNSIQFSYSRRINRPSFRQLAPWFYFNDPTTVLTGNPKLQPSTTNAIRGSYIWKRLNFSAQYAHTKGAIGRFVPNIDKVNNTQVNGAKNFVSGNNASATVSFPLNIKKWWEVRTSWTGQWQEYNDEVEGRKISFGQKGWFMNGSSTFTLPKKFTIEISGNYFSPMLMGAVRWRANNRVDVGIQKEFDKNGTLRFSVNDIFLGGNYTGDIDNPDLGFVYRGFYGFTERVFRLTYSIRFGNQKVRGARKRATGSAEEQRRTN